jgi:enamine deaminase RidA (YjgF/YER057c/UK114 family)
MRAILAQIEAISVAAGTSLANLCRLKVFMDGWNMLAPAAQELANAFPIDPPAVSMHRVNGSPMLAPGCHIVGDAISYVP